MIRRRSSVNETRGGVNDVALNSKGHRRDVATTNISSAITRATSVHLTTCLHSLKAAVPTEHERDSFRCEHGSRGPCCLVIVHVIAVALDVEVCSAKGVGVGGRRRHVRVQMTKGVHLRAVWREYGPEAKWSGTVEPIALVDSDDEVERVLGAPKREEQLQVVQQTASAHGHVPQPAMGA